MRRLLALPLLLLSLLAADAAGAANTANPAANPASKLVYVIPIRDEIEQTMTYVVRRGVREAVAAKADVIVLNMNTNGGRTDSMEEIVRAVEAFPNQEATYTYVDKKAASAGAFISSSTSHIYMAPGSVIGAATPVMVSSGEVKALPESYEKKITSFFEAMGRATAERHGHNPLVFQAMVARDAGLVVDGVTIVPKGQILTLTNTEAEKKYGAPPKPLLSEGTVPSLDALVALAAGPGARVVTVAPTGFERIARFLTLIAPILMAAGMALGYLEFKTPGTMVFGILAAVCFLLFFLGQYVAGLSGYEPVVLFLVGLALITVELFLLPGLLLPVLTGLLFVIAALLYAMANHSPSGGPFLSLAELGGPLLKLVLAFVLASGAIGLIVRYFPEALLTRAIERATIHGAPVASLPTSGAHLVRIGDEGRAITLLRPAGTARFGESRVDVVSDGALIASGTRVRVVQVEGIRVVVESLG